jgi:hypothetical protein
MLKVDFGKQTKRRKQAFEWLSKFKSGVISVEDAKCLACPQMSKTDEKLIK